MRIVLFSSGGLMGLLPIKKLAVDHDVVVVLPRYRTPKWKWVAKRVGKAVGVFPQDPVARWTMTAGVPVVTAASGTDTGIADAMRDFKADLACIVTFPWKLDSDLLSIPRLGTVNAHPSLLPRHRGPNPYFWTYFHNDRTTGVTVHVATDQVDGGPILVQAEVGLARGQSMDNLYKDLARCCERLVSETVNNFDRLMEESRPQDEALATKAPRVERHAPMVDFDTWDVERVWHFLAGLYPRHIEPLRDTRGQKVRYRGVMGFEQVAHENTIGIARPSARGWELCCQGGYVLLGRSKFAGKTMAPDA